MFGVENPIVHTITSLRHVAERHFAPYGQSRREEPHPPVLPEPEPIALGPISRPEGPAGFIYDIAYDNPDHPLAEVFQEGISREGVVPAGVIENPPNIKGLVEVDGENGEVVFPPIVEVFNERHAT